MKMPEMLAPLGVTRLGDAPAAAAASGGQVVAQGALAAVVAPAGAVAVASDRAARACAAAAAVPAFAPVSRGAADAPSIRAWLAAERQAFAAALDRLSGRAEWVLTRRWPTAVDAAAAELAAAAAAARDGRGWLRARARQAATTEEAAARASVLLAALAERAATVAVETRLAPFPGGADLAILAPRASGPRLRALFGPDRAALSLSGPWPAFSFVSPLPARAA